MNLFANQDVRRFFGQIAAILLLLLLSGWLFSNLIISDFKTRLLTHDYHLAGYLLQHGASPSEVSSMFAAHESSQQLSSGKKLLQSQGYTTDVSTSLLPDAYKLRLRYRIILASFTLILAALLFGASLRYFRRQQKAIDKANSAINIFMEGDTSARIESDAEGDLFKLLASVNTMATSLNSHIDAEKHNKDFLRDTISDISHQLKTPLAALKIYNEILSEESTNEDTIKTFTLKTNNALERMETLINNLLKITKIDAGTIVFNRTETNIQQLLSEIVSGFETRMKLEHKTISLNGASHTMLFCDQDWLTESIVNLVKNALDHTAADGQIAITWEETPVLTRIMVKDNGSGIYPDDIHHIFKRFYRSRFSQDSPGIGLGLSLAKSIVEAHNGTITVDSTIGKGSLFTLDFLKLNEL